MFAWSGGDTVELLEVTSFQDIFVFVLWLLVTSQAQGTVHFIWEFPPPGLGLSWTLLTHIHALLFYLLKGKKRTQTHRQSPGMSEVSILQRTDVFLQGWEQWLLAATQDQQLATAIMGTSWFFIIVWSFSSLSTTTPSSNTKAVPRQPSLLIEVACIYRMCTRE